MNYDGYMGKCEVNIIRLSQIFGFCHKLPDYIYFYAVVCV